jgi:hypothetical protein
MAAGIHEGATCLGDKHYTIIEQMASGMSTVIISGMKGCSIAIFKGHREFRIRSMVA